MDPYGTFGAQKGISPPPPSPKTSISAIPEQPRSSGVTGSWSPNTGGYLDPTVKSFQPMAYKNPSEATDYGKLSIMEQAIKSYESIPSAPRSGQQEVQVSVTGEEAPESADSWRQQIYADRAAAQNRSGGYVGGGSGVTGDPNRAPFEAMEVPELPKFEGTAYNPPAEDEGVYAKKRREAMGPGMRELREGTREAISSAQSLDNPNARGKFIQQALKGYGQGLEKVAAGAGREATSEARRARSEQLDLYKTQHSIKSDAYLKNYQNEINNIAANFASQQNAQAVNWDAGINEEGGGAPNARSKSTYYNSNTPNMGYFAG